MNFVVIAVLIAAWGLSIWERFRHRAEGESPDGSWDDISLTSHAIHRAAFGILFGVLGLAWWAPLIGWPAWVAGAGCGAVIGVVVGRVQIETWDSIVRRQNGPFLPIRECPRTIPRWGNILFCLLFILAIPVEYEVRHGTSEFYGLGTVVTGAWMAVSSYYAAKGLRILSWAKRKQAEGHGGLVVRRTKPVSPRYHPPIGG